MSPGDEPELREVLIPDPSGDQIVVRIDAVGVCHTDLAMAPLRPPSQLPMILGHEGTGVVEAVGSDVTRVHVGQRVVLTFDACGTCARCRSDESAYCDTTTARNVVGSASGVSLPDGTPVTTGFFGQSSFGHHALASQRNAIPLREDIGAELAAPLGCSVQTGYGTVVNVLRPAGGDGVVIFGAGAVGMSALLAARQLGAVPIVVEPQPLRRERALELGAAEVFDPTVFDQGQLIAAVRASVGGGAHCAIDTTAIPAVLSLAAMCLRKRGSLAVVGLGAMNAELPVAVIMAAGLRVQGVVEGDSTPHTFIPHLAGLVADGRLPIDRIIETYPFSRFGDAWACAAAGTGLKPVLVVDR